MPKTRITLELFWMVVFVCILPIMLNLLGANFGSPPQASYAFATHHLDDKKQTIDVMHYALSGSFTHTILEWSAFCTAIFAVLLSLIHSYLKGEIITLIIGIALFSAGCMDAFHTLAADRLVQGLANNQNFVPFTWAISRLFNALILLCGTGLFLFFRPIDKDKNLILIMLSSLFCSFVALGIVFVCTYSNALPNTVFPDSVVTHPWDIAPLFLFLFAGFVVFPRFYYRYPSLFSHSLIISTIPQVATQIHMAFGSTELFDNNFNIAHFLKIIAYLVPVIGLSLDYVRTYRQEVDTTKQLEKAIGVFDSILLEDNLH